MIDIESQIAEFQRHLNVSRETLARLNVYHNSLRKWNPVINLVGQSTIDNIWTRHFLDSAQLWNLRPKKISSWIDLGSGAGFPGLIIAALAADEDPNLKIELVESDARKSAFLINTSQLMDVPVTVLTSRIESLNPKPRDVVSARALAPLNRLLNYAAPLADQNTCLIFPKGKEIEKELTEAKNCWTFTHQNVASITETDGVILKIGGLGRV